MPHLSTRRRRFLGGLATIAAVTAGCVVEDDTDGTEIQDSDGDGVIDSEDYAPNDPAVQRKSDVNATQSSPPQQPTETATETATETSTQTPTETPTTTPPENVSYPSHTGTHTITARDNFWAWEFSVPVEFVLDYEAINTRDETYDFDILLYTPEKFEEYRAIAAGVEDGIRPQYLEGSAPGVESGVRGTARLPAGTYYLVIDNTDLSDAGDWGAEDVRQVRLDANTRSV